jgi:hypothetical protein
VSCPCGTAVLYPRGTVACDPVSVLLCAGGLPLGAISLTGVQGSTRRVRGAC